MILGKRVTTEEFISRAEEVHGDTYDYSRVDYKRNSTHVEIICSQHGSFYQSPANHLKGYGCTKCNRDIWDANSFINKSKDIHGEAYDYSQVVFKTTTDKVEITCKIHGSFWQLPHNHTKGHGCHKCRDELTSSRFSMTQEDFETLAKNVHGNLYSYEKTEYVLSRKKVIITCKLHGDFSQTPNSHLSGGGCQACAVISNSNNLRHTTTSFVHAAQLKHGNKYDYSLVEYKNLREKVKILCRTHGEFLMTPDSHLQGSNCPYCAKYGFRNIDNGILYILTDGEIIKVGITNYNLADRVSRIRKKSGRNFEVLKTYEGSGYSVSSAEVMTLKWLKENSSPINEKFTGSTECFYGVNLPQLLNLTEKIINDNY